MWFLVDDCLSLRARRKHLDGEVFEMLLTFTDFVAFKEMVLDYKAVSTTVQLIIVDWYHGSSYHLMVLFCLAAFLVSFI